MNSQRKVIPFDFSIGGWCLQNRGTTPFSDEAVRSFTTEEALHILADSGSGIEKVSFHDGDLWSAIENPTQVMARIEQVKKFCETLGLEVYNFTTNLFSDKAFRSGAYSSPFPEVREAAILKACRGVEAAKLFGAKHMIHWLGCCGTDGAYEQDPRIAHAQIATGLSVVGNYGLEINCFNLLHSDEPKQYEPRKKSLYHDSGATSAAFILGLLPDWLRKYFRINPEYPQHVTMLNGDPVNELGLLLALGLLAPFIHLGGQITGRMDCDSEPGFGGDYYTDFMILLNLQRAGWKGVIEFDCRPERTTTTAEGVIKFLKGCTSYVHFLEAKVQQYFNDAEIQQLESELTRPQTSMLLALEAGLANRSVLAEVRELSANFKGFDAAHAVSTDCIQDYARRVKQIVMGVAA